MMNRSFFLLILLFLLVCSSCDDESSAPENNPEENALNVIMPLGASRVEGARPIYESYRYELWKKLIDGNWEFDYIGTENDDASYPEHAGMSFDMDHEGRGGWTSGQILAGIAPWLRDAGIPDIVLFSSPGGNDALQNLPYDQAISNINAIIDVIQSVNVNVTIIIEKMAPARSNFMTPQLSTYFTQMQQDVVTIATEQTDSNSKVIVVDIASGFNDSFFADPVHYNEEGAAFVADKYYEVLTGILER